MQNLIIYIIFFHLIFNVNCQYAPVGRNLHTASLVGTKIYFLGGSTSRVAIEKAPTRLNDFFYLDITRSFDKAKEPLPFVDLSSKALEIPPHFGAATSVFGELKDTIFLFGGNMGKLNSQSRLTYSFNTTQLQWNSVTVSQGAIPDRKQITGAVTDNNDKIYIFGGGKVDNSKGFYSNGMNIFGATNKFWFNGADGPVTRDGHTATILPDTGEIIYIGGLTYNDIINDFELIDMTNLDVYNTIGNSWSKLTTRNLPEPRYGHTAVLTNDKRIIVFGGAQVNIGLPVKNYYVVLDTKTLEWYHGKEDLSTRAPFKHHTATLYSDYMFIAFGYVYSIDSPFSNDVLIYKIGEYANFTEVDNFISTNEDTVNHSSILLALLFFGINIFGVTLFIIFKPYFFPRRIEV